MRRTLKERHRDASELSGASSSSADTVSGRTKATSPPAAPALAPAVSRVQTRQSTRRSTSRYRQLNHRLVQQDAGAKSPRAPVASLMDADDMPINVIIRKRKSPAQQHDHAPRAGVAPAPREDTVRGNAPSAATPLNGFERPYPKRSRLSQSHQHQPAPTPVPTSAPTPVQTPVQAPALPPAVRGRAAVSKSPWAPAAHRQQPSQAPEILVREGESEDEEGFQDAVEVIDGNVLPTQGATTQPSHPRPKHYSQRDDDDADQDLADQRESVHGSAEVTRRRRGKNEFGHLPNPLQPFEPANAPTAAALFTTMFPQLPLANLNGSLYRLLAGRTVQRIPEFQKPFADNKPQNIPSLLMQAVGKSMAGETACKRCLSTKTATYVGCVVVTDPNVMAITAGACANCWYNRQGCLCNIRDQSNPTINGKSLQRSVSRLSYPYPAVSLAPGGSATTSPTAAPPAEDQTPISAVPTLRPGHEPQQQRDVLSFSMVSGKSAYYHQTPREPSAPAAHGAGSSSHAATHHPAQKSQLAMPGSAYSSSNSNSNGIFQSPGLPTPAPTITTSAPAPAPAPAPMATVAYMSLERKIDTWEKRFRELTPDAISEQQKKLMAMQEDINAQVAALTKVCVARMTAGG